MTVLLNNQDTRIQAGTHSFSASGPLTLEWDIGNGFVPFTGGEFTAAEDVNFKIRACKIKSTLAGANTLTIDLISQ